MKKIINGVEYESFAPDKNAEELGIDTSRKFIVLKGDIAFKEGSIIAIHRDDYTSFPYFKNIDEKVACFYWDDLAYYDEPKERKFKVGDRVRIKSKSVGNYRFKDIEIREGVITEIDKEYYGRKDIIKIKEYYFVPEDLELLEKAGGCFSLELVEKAIRIVNKEKEVNLNKQNKFMSIITNAFKSKENKALEHFNLGTTDKLNEQGRNEFTDFIYETGTTDKKEFFKRIVKAYEEDTKK